MCGRFTRYTDIEQIEKLFDVHDGSIVLAPSYNVAPTQPVLAVVQSEGEKRLVVMRWGLVPVWAKDISIGSRMINARAETLMEKASFKRPFKSQRCLVVSDGFFEWRKEGTKKVPVYIRLKSKKPFGFAGLYDTWTSPDGEQIVSCTIITTASNDLIQPIHDRMPAILPKRQYKTWLDPKNQRFDALSALLAPYPAAEMEAYEVSRLVNAPANNSPQCIEPVPRTVPDKA